MCRMYYFFILGLFFSSLNAVPLPAPADDSTWDVAVTRGQQIEFYKDSLSVDLVGDDFTRLTQLTYDPVSNMLLFVGIRQGDESTIFGYDIANKEFKSMGKPSTGVDYIKSLAYDPVEGKLFWIDTSDNSICWAPVESGTIGSETKNILYQKETNAPESIAIDSCRRYIYWTNSGNTIEKARYDGTEWEVVMNTNSIPYSLALDQQTKSIYWFEPGYVLLTADLDGNNKKDILSGWAHTTNKLTITKDSIYLEDDSCYLVWSLPKNTTDPTPVTIVSNGGRMYSIAANYQIKDQTQGNAECQALTKLVEPEASVPCEVPVMDPFCVHGTQVNGTKTCECIPGYFGERCDVSVCHNFCFSGDCTVTADGEPHCSCSSGYSGERCVPSIPPQPPQVPQVPPITNNCCNSGSCSHTSENHDQNDCCCKSQAVKSFKRFIMELYE